MLVEVHLDTHGYRGRIGPLKPICSPYHPGRCCGKVSYPFYFGSFGFSKSSLRQARHSHLRVFLSSKDRTHLSSLGIPNSKLPFKSDSLILRRTSLRCDCFLFPFVNELMRNESRKPNSTSSWSVMLTPEVDSASAPCAFLSEPRRDSQSSILKMKCKRHTLPITENRSP